MKVSKDTLRILGKKIEFNHEFTYCRLCATPVEVAILVDLGAKPDHTSNKRQSEYWKFDVMQHRIRMRMGDCKPKYFSFKASARIIELIKKAQDIDG